MLRMDAYAATGVRRKLTLRKENTKGKQETRQIPVNVVLQGYLECYAVEAGKLYLCPGRHGRGHLNPRSADEILRERCECLGLEGVSTHSFRRTALTQMSGEGVPLRVIQEISGHRSLQALQRYLEVTPEQKRKAVEVIGF